MSHKVTLGIPISYLSNWSKKTFHQNTSVVIVFTGGSSDSSASVAFSAVACSAVASPCSAVASPCSAVASPC